MFTNSEEQGASQVSLTEEVYKSKKYKQEKDALLIKKACVTFKVTHYSIYSLVHPPEGQHCFLHPALSFLHHNREPNDG